MFITNQQLDRVVTALRNFAVPSIDSTLRAELEDSFGLAADNKQVDNFIQWLETALVQPRAKPIGLRIVKKDPARLIFELIDVDVAKRYFLEYSTWRFGSV